MATKTLSISLSPISLPHKLRNPNPNLLQTIHLKKPTLIVCKSTPQLPAQAHQASPIAQPELQGTGAAAPTRGELFLERHQSVAASARVLNAGKNTKKKKKKESISDSLRISTRVASCYGCGAPLQTLETDLPGYVDSETFELV